MITTLKGLNLQAKTHTGVGIIFTKVVFGDGLPDDITILSDPFKLKNYLKNLNSLISPKMTTTIQSIKTPGNGTSVIRTIISNINLDTGFPIREIGILADDPDEGEILYSVDNLGFEVDFLPAKGGTWVVEEILDLITIVGNAEIVAAVINESLTFATKSDLTNHKKRRVMSEKGVHGIRYYENNLQVFDGEKWINIYLPGGGTEPSPPPGSQFSIDTNGTLSNTASYGTIITNEDDDSLTLAFNSGFATVSGGTINLKQGR